MTAFGSLRITGGLLPADLLDAVFAGDPKLPGTAPASYGLEHGESVRRQASRSWLYLLEVWQEFQRRLEQAGDGPDATDARSARVTRERWLRILLRELGFHPETADGAFELGGKSFPVSHRDGHVPIHLLGYGTDLDHRTAKVTARAPQSMVQELLNVSDDYLWALLSNGAALRLLRDCATLTGSAYVEFDLDTMFGGELFSDFVLLYLICHQSRFAASGGGGPASCYLEQWRAAAAEQGERALDQLRTGVQQAISILGTGFLAHPDNPQLRARLEPGAGDLSLDDLNRALLRVVYRLLFWFVAEDRNALLQPDPTDADPATRARLREARDRYAAYFSSERLRRHARRHRGGRHGDLWEAVRLVFDALGAEGGLPELALPGLGGIFESAGDDGRALPLDEPLAGACLANEALLGAVRALSLTAARSGGGLRRVDFGSLGAEELGSVYESLLELVPRYDDEQLSYTLETLPGNERKETGSYYTPTSLVECLLDSALDPLLDQAAGLPTAADRIEALLDITVCDPACGSGHFLVAAARRIAKRVAAEETGEPEPPEPAVQAALRQVAGRCIYGVDVNPMAAELARVSLWLEALEPGKPLSFLDENIRVGNSLLGVTPALLAQGLPDEAFNPIEGDDKNAARWLRAQNVSEKAGQGDLFSPGGIPVANARLARNAAAISRVLPGSLEDLHIQQQRQAAELASSAELRQQKLLADAWCAAFVQPKDADTRGSAITQRTMRALAADDRTLELAAAESLVDRLTRQYRFFHWHVEFPHIFRVGDGSADVNPDTGWAGGFSCVIGNPPWERVKLQEQEFFAARSPEIANAPNAAARKKMIAALLDSESPIDRALHDDFRAELRKASGWSHLLRDSGRYPLTGQGDINTYSVFAETARTVIAPKGRAGLILPTGIATDATTAPFFRDIVQQRRLDSLLDFVTNPQFWQEIGHGRMRFSLLTIVGMASTVQESEFATLVKHPSELPPPGRRIKIPTSELLLVNPNTGTCPMFQTQRDAEITIGIYKRVPVLWRDDPEENPWGLSFMAMYHMANDSGLFRTRETLEADGWKLTGNVFTKDGKRMLPLYEAKLIHHYDHRLACYSKRPEGSQDTELPRLDLSEKEDPNRAVQPRYWVQEFDTKDEARSTREKAVYAAVGVTSRLATRRWDRGWLLGWRDICRSTDERTVISAAIPRAAVGDKYLLAFTPHDASLLQANLSSFTLDYAARQKFAGTSLKYYLIKQLPVLPPGSYDEPVAWLGHAAPATWIRQRVLELSYTAWDMESFARDLGDDGPPFRWDDERRMLIRAELDAAYFHLYGLDRDEVEHVMGSFDALRRREEKQLGEFRTKRLILDRYDAMAEAAQANKPYQTILDPPPGHGPRHAARSGK
ncbi:MAG: Eco57I restriction-modification methylase domain-containing protein [Streptosporangiaceae bacterium]